MSAALGIALNPGLTPSTAIQESEFKSNLGLRPESNKRVKEDPVTQARAGNLKQTAAKSPPPYRTPSVLMCFCRAAGEQADWMQVNVQTFRSCKVHYSSETDYIKIFLLQHLRFFAKTKNLRSNYVLIACSVSLLVQGIYWLQFLNMLKWCSGVLGSSVTWQRSVLMAFSEWGRGEIIFSDSAPSAVLSWFACISLGCLQPFHASAPLKHSAFITFIWDLCCFLGTNIPSGSKPFPRETQIQTCLRQSMWALKC